MIDPGQTINLDYSLTQTFPLQRSLNLQLGLVGYGQWQTTDKHSPNITPDRQPPTTKLTPWASQQTQYYQSRR